MKFNPGNKQIALVTGSNRGIGKEIARQLAQEHDWYVIITSRTIEKARKAAEEIGENTFPMELDVSSHRSLDAFENFLTKDLKHLDALINNAGILGSNSITRLDMEEIRNVMGVNVFGVMEVTKRALPFLKKASDPRIVNMSSGMGTFSSTNSGSHGAYRLSKWTLNGFTRMLASDLTDVKVNAMSPGWVATDMGGSSAPRSLEQGADTAVWLATEKNIPTGKFWMDRKEFDW